MNNRIFEKPILYCVHGSHDIGLGHIMRARSLCTVLRRNTIQPLVLTSSPDYVVSEIASWGVQVENVPDGDIYQKALSYRDRYNARIVVQDVRDTDEATVRALADEDFYLIHFDDLGSGRDYADVLIDANLSEKQISSISGQIRMFGKQYMVMDPVFSEIHDRDKSVAPVVRNLVISLGGSDPRNLTPWIVELLGSHLQKFQIKVVVGSGVKDAERVKQLCSKFHYEYIYDTDSMGELLYEADIAIISGGVTLYEAVASGTPSLVLPQVEHQYDIGREFERLGFCFCPFSYNEKDAWKFLQAFSRVIKNKELREAMSLRGKEIIDAKGVFRIANLIGDIVRNQCGETDYVTLRQ
ncbi:MAG: hypothetical protein C4541_01385 [Candidatus Auribacter fodinae]|jgi:spore coat polysaccharide biosynthesis predicted glycosyltransferase SpsG|uniref:Glycosyl transferase family 28 C-terminal domain-containing protein n=1 Tax=Candidatus Auribacter fodinae TaxID=2093366 RepID=A0A3A4R5S7_9BACT|nr:MAG: hypothetical protein C4541_01385 [Candidatus Auribacter fodinae]